MNDETIRDLYRQVNSLPGDAHGPIPIDPQARRILERLRPSLMEAASAVRLAPPVKGRDYRCLEAPTPWHAYFHMRLNVEWAHDEPGKNHPIYRGQADSSWSLIPSLKRSKDPEVESRALEEFRDLFDKTLGPNCVPRPSCDALVAAAQHYGIATNFLDFTPDPATAVFFACDGSTAKRVTVFQLPLLPALTRGARVRLPPPFVGRLYIQRGIFVDSTAWTGSPLQDECTRIEFPPRPDFRVIRGGTEIQLRCADLLEHLAGLAKRLAREPEEHHHNAWTVPDARLADVPEFASEWVELASDTLYWLAIVTNAEGQGCQPDELRYIAQQNRPLMEHFAAECTRLADLIERGGDTEMAKDHRRLAGHVRDALRAVPLNN